MKTAAPTALLAFLAAGCSSAPSLAPAQLEAAQTRTVDAPPEPTFRAAAGVMLDRGMIITLSDSAAGLVGARQWNHGPVADAHHPPDSLNAPTEVVAWIRPGAGGASLVRVQFCSGGSTVVDPERVSRFVDEIGRRALAVAATRGATQ